MGSLLVVLEHPPIRRLSNVLDAQEQILVQHLFSEGAIESLDIGVLIGLAGLNVLNRHAVDLRPLHEALT